jgi:hypothetical protein
MPRHARHFSTSFQHDSRIAREGAAAFAYFE